MTEVIEQKDFREELIKILKNNGADICVPIIEKVNINLTSDIPLLGVDREKTFHINPEVFNGLTDVEKVFFIAHEIEHVLTIEKLRK